jgi:hypothetical protein
MALRSTKPVTEMNTRNPPGGKGRSARKVDNFTAICEQIVYKMWEPPHPTTLWGNFWEFPEWLHNWQLLRKGSAP